MDKFVIARDVVTRFPGLEVAWVALEGLDVAGARAADVAAFKTRAEAAARKARTLDTVKDDPSFRAYRDFYWALGIDPTKTRPSAEALNRRILRGNPLPTINPFVDAYNAASLETGVSIGAYDADKVSGDLALRFARTGESFRGIGEAGPRALAGGETILADDAQIINFYPYRDADATKVTDATTRAIIVTCGVPGLGPAALEAAARAAAANVTGVVGGRAGTVFFARRA